MLLYIIRIAGGGMQNFKPLSDKERFARSRLRQILNTSGLIRASWVLLRHPCGWHNCRCARGKRYWHKTFYISQSHKGILRRKSIPKEIFGKVDNWLKHYWEARRLLDRISEEYWAYLKKFKKRRYR